MRSCLMQVLRHLHVKSCHLNCHAGSAFWSRQGRPVRIAAALSSHLARMSPNRLKSPLPPS